MGLCSSLNFFLRPHYCVRSICVCFRKNQDFVVLGAHTFFFIEAYISDNSLQDDSSLSKCFRSWSFFFPYSTNSNCISIQFTEQDDISKTSSARQHKCEEAIVANKCRCFTFIFSFTIIDVEW